jgi:transposase, IS5 family
MPAPPGGVFVLHATALPGNPYDGHTLAGVILSGVGHNLRLVLAWLKILLRLILIALGRLFTIPTALNPAS